MKNIFTKKNLMPLIVLSSICLVVAALMGGVNLITEQRIFDNEQKKISASLSDVMPNGVFEKIEIPEDAPSTVTAIYKDSVSGGHVVTLAKQGYASIIKITVGIDIDQKVTNMIITNQQETHGKDISSLIASLAGANNAKEVESVDVVTGATKTSGYIKSAVYDAFVALGYAAPKVEAEFDNAGVTDTTDEEVIAIAKELMAGDYEKTSTEGMPTTVKGVYKNSNGGYAIHIATRTQYVPLETNGVVTVDKSGEITGIKMINWVVGYDKDLLDSAPICEDYFLRSFVGKNSDSLKRVELVTNATLSSNNFTDALTEAMDILYPVKTYTIIGIVCAGVCAAAVISYCVYINVKRRKNG